MIYAEYQNNEITREFTIRFANVELSDPGFKQVNATYHLENAIRKAFDGQARPDKFLIKVVDPNNHYLKLIAIAFVAFVQGFGYSYPDLKTENF